MTPGVIVRYLKTGSFWKVQVVDHKKNTYHVIALDGDRQFTAEADKFELLWIQEGDEFEIMETSSSGEKHIFSGTVIKIYTELKESSKSRIKRSTKNPKGAKLTHEDFNEMLQLKTTDGRLYISELKFAAEHGRFL